MPRKGKAPKGEKPQSGSPPPSARGRMAEKIDKRIDFYTALRDKGRLEPEDIRRLEHGQPMILDQGVICTLGPPPLMIFYDRKLSIEEHEKLVNHFCEAVAKGGPIVVCPPVVVYQCVEGRWRRIGPEGGSDAS